MFCQRKKKWKLKTAQLLKAYCTRFDHWSEFQCKHVKHPCKTARQTWGRAKCLCFIPANKRSSWLDYWGPQIEKKKKKLDPLPPAAFLIQPQSIEKGISSHKARVNEYKTLWEKTLGGWSSHVITAEQTSWSHQTWKSEQTRWTYKWEQTVQGVF